MEVYLWEEQDKIVYIGIVLENPRRIWDRWSGTYRRPGSISYPMFKQLYKISFNKNPIVKFGIQSMKIQLITSFNRTY